MKKSLILLVSLCILSITINAQVQIRVLTYNILNFPDPTNNDAVGSDANRVQAFRQVVENAGADIILIQELKTDAGANLLLNELNANGTLGKTYNRAPSFTAYGPSSFVLGNMLLYNDDLIDFCAQEEVPRNNTAISPTGSPVVTPRAISRYVMKVVNPACVDQQTDVEFYSVHLKAGDSDISSTAIADRDRRDLGAQDLMDFINALATTSNIVVGGDFNFYDESVVNAPPSGNDEPAYNTLTTTANANFLIDVIGAWTRNTAGDVAKFTQSTRSIFDAYGNGGVNGQLDDRFDFLFFNSAVNTGINDVTYVGGSYQTFGNTGVALNNDVVSGSSPVKTQLDAMSDHYPVILDLNVTFDPLQACNDCTPVIATFPANPAN